MGIARASRAPSANPVWDTTYTASRCPPLRRLNGRGEDVPIATRSTSGSRPTMDDNMLMLMTLATCSAMAMAVRMWQWLADLQMEDSQEDLP